jgi:hypothetical protein
MAKGTQKGMSIGEILPLILAVFGGMGCLIAGFRTLWRKRLIDDLPTSKTQGTFIGLTELKGTAESEAPLISCLAGARCVHYTWEVEEHWSKTVHETYTDSKGHTQTRIRTESGWTNVAGGGQSIPFYLKDDTGIIRIVPQGADIKGISTFQQTCSPDDPMYYSKGPAAEVVNSTHQRNFSETALPLHTMLYVIGQARERQDIAAAEIAQDKNAEMFLISTDTEKQISTGYTVLLWFWLIFGLCLAVGGTVAWDMMSRRYSQLNWQTIVIAAGAFILAVLLGWIWTVYNSLVNLHHIVERGWSQVDIQLKRRNDLIPNLETMVKGYGDYESNTQKLLTELRTQLEATPPGIAGADYKGISLMIRAAAEHYPDIKAGESFLKLQQELEDTEQRIALARDYFNNTATFYNTRLSIIPDRFLGNLLKLRPRTLMSAADFERATVEVNLAD